jgi:hypothetical protein
MLTKVYCENCRFSEMEMKFVNAEQWYQKWWCKNPKFATMENPVNKPFVGKVECRDQNKNCNCAGFEAKKSFWQKISGWLRRQS